MTKLESIYASVVCNLPERRQEDDRLTARIKEAVNNLDCPEEERQKLSEAMFEGSSYGQLSGFVSGFRFAVSLLAECLV